MKRAKNYLFQFIGEDSDREGEEFFVYADSFHQAIEIVNEHFPNEEIAFRGLFNDLEAECLGYDTF